MKKLVFLLTLSLASIQFTYGQLLTSNDSNWESSNMIYTEIPDVFQSNTISKNEKKVKGYRGMRRTGIVLTAVGVPLAVGSTALIISESKKDSNYFESDFKIILGAVGLVGGGVCTIAGVTLWAIGGKKMNQYKKADNVSFDVGPNSFKLCYNF